MSLMLIFLLFLISACLLRTGRRRKGSITFLITSAIFLSIGLGVLPGFLLNQLQTFDHVSKPLWKSKNAVVVLGLGTVRWPQSDFVSTHTLGYSRIQEAARLYFDCKRAKKVCHILTSGGDPSKIGKSEAAVMARELEDLGVDKQDMIIEGESKNTFQNAEFASKILIEGGFDRIYLVTSGTHLKRSLLYFSHFLPTPPEPAPSDRLEPIRSYLPLAHNFTYLDIALHEAIGSLRYDIYNVLGWNAGSARAGAF